MRSCSNGRMMHPGRLDVDHMHATLESLVVALGNFVNRTDAGFGKHAYKHKSRHTDTHMGHKHILKHAYDYICKNMHKYKR